MINWIKRHKFWTAIILILVVSIPLDVLGVISIFGVSVGLGMVIFFWALWKAGKWMHKRQRLWVTISLAVVAIALIVLGVMWVL